MSLPIITADQRLAEPRGIKGCIFGKSGIGKTSLLWTLDPACTLFIDLEAGDLAIEGWPGDSIRPRTWTECRDFAVFIGGPNPALRDEQPYSPAHYKAVCDRFGDPAALDRYDTIFVDSITVAGRLCFQWCKGQPEAGCARSLRAARARDDRLGLSAQGPLGPSGSGRGASSRPPDDEDPRPCRASAQAPDLHPATRRSGG